MGECGVLIETMFSVPTRNKISSGIDTKLYFPPFFFSPSILLIRRNSENLFKVFIILFFYHFIFYGRMKTIQSLRKVCAFENLNMKFNKFKAYIVSKFSTKKRGNIYIYIYIYIYINKSVKVLKYQQVLLHVHQVPQVPH